MYFIIKTLISALVIASVTQLSEKAPLGAAFLKSLPLTSLLVFFFMKYEGRSESEIIAMSWDILYLVLPSLLLFIALPVLMGRGVRFVPALFLAMVVMSLGYAVTFKLMNRPLFS